MECTHEVNFFRPTKMQDIMEYVTEGNLKELLILLKEFIPEEVLDNFINVGPYSNGIYKVQITSNINVRVSESGYLLFNRDSVHNFSVTSVKALLDELSKCCKSDTEFKIYMYVYNRLDKIEKRVSLT
jgi:hypothetical protein